MKYDAIIIGSGQAGTPLSFALADLGWTVALIERANLGGTCINTGCTPTKTMVHRAQVAHYARDAARWGVLARDVGVDLSKIVAQKNQLIQGRRDRQQKGIDRYPNLHLYRGVAQFTGPHQVRVKEPSSGNPLLESERIFINTGGRPTIPAVPGLETAGYLTNENIMDLTQVPEHLVVLGAGYVGLEFAQMFARFGSRVTVIQAPRSDRSPRRSGGRCRIAESAGGRRHPISTQCPNHAGGEKKTPRSFLLSSREAARRESPDRTFWWQPAVAPTLKTSISPKPEWKPVKTARSGSTAGLKPMCPASGLWET